MPKPGGSQSVKWFWDARCQVVVPPDQKSHIGVRF